MKAHKSLWLGIICLIPHAALWSQDLGKLGHTFAIQEPDLLALMQQKQPPAFSVSQWTPEQTGPQVPRATHSERRHLRALPKDLTLRYDYLFLDATDPAQVAWLRQFIPHSPDSSGLRLILLAGDLRKLSAEMTIPVYWDYGGQLRRQLAIQALPARLHTPKESKTAVLDSIAIDNAGKPL